MEVSRKVEVSLMGSRGQNVLSVRGKAGVAMPVAEAVVTADWSVAIPTGETRFARGLSV